jgi:putative SbcD/Mre11-related phosphoesterase
VIEPIHGHPALTFSHGGEVYLVVADVHIGMECELEERGMRAPSQTRRMASLIASLGEQFGARRLVIVGDAKHNLPRLSLQERFEVPRFFELLEEQFESVDLARGNHDGGVDYLAPRSATIHPASGFALGPYGFCHGHSWPSEEVAGAETLVVAHSHPTALFKDGIGRRATERCWLRGRWSRCGRYPEARGSFVLMPALHPYLGGTPVNERGKGILGPLFKNKCLDADGARVYLLDGTCLGAREKLLV